MLSYLEVFAGPGDGFPLAFADHRQGRALLQVRLDVGDGGDLLAVDFEEDVALLEAGGFGDAAFLDPDDDEAFPGGEVELGAKGVGRLLERGARHAVTIRLLLFKEGGQGNGAGDDDAGHVPEDGGV